MLTTRRVHYSMDAEEYLFELSENPLPARLQNFRLTKKHVDLQLIIGNHAFDCHKLVLKTSPSPVLDRKLQELQYDWSYPSCSSSTSLRGQLPGCATIELDEDWIEPEVVEELLNFFYIAKFRFTVVNAKFACLASFHLQLPELLSASEEYLCRHIEETNLVEYYRLSLRCDLGILHMGCLTYLVEHHTLLYMTQERYFVDFELDEIVQLFQELHEVAPTNLDLKESIFYCINQWIHQDLKIRQYSLETLLNAIPLDELRFRFLADHVAEHTAIRKSDRCSQLLIDALVKTSRVDPEMVAKHFTSGLSSHVTSTKTLNTSVMKTKTSSKTSTSTSTVTKTKAKAPSPPKPSRQVSFSQAQNTKHTQNLCVLSGTGKGNTSERFSLSTLTSGSEKWTTTKKFSTRRDILAVTAINKRIFIAGRPLGSDPKSIQNLWGVLPRRQRDDLNDILCGMMPFEEYDLETQEWKVHEYLPYMRDSFGMCSLNGQVYIAGGRDANGFELATALRYDPRKMEWKSLAEMNKKRSNVKLVELEGCLYAIGGEGLDCIEKYDPMTGKWTLVSGMNNCQISEVSAVSHNRKLYVLSRESFEMYSPASETWFSLPGCPTEIREGANLVSFNDQLLAIGGNNCLLVYEFDTLTRKWKQHPGMDMARKFNFSVVVNEC